MTSVAIISGAVARIQYLKTQPGAESSLANDIECIDRVLEVLKTIKQQLIEKKLFHVEKDIVLLSYEILDAITDLSSKSKEKLSAVRWLDSWKKSEGSTTKLGGLEKNLEDLGKRKPPEPEGKFIKSEAERSEEVEEAAAGITSLHKLKEQLSKQSSESSVVCILGPHGMGKTTLANKLFNDAELRRRFDFFAWVPINHNFQMKGVLQAILKQVRVDHPPQELDIKNMNEIELIAQIFAALGKNRYLLVLDDIDAVEDWHSLRFALPNANSIGIIITTSSLEVANEATRSNIDAIHKVPGLEQPQILQILEEQKAISSPKSKEVMKAISDISGGSPLIATILGKFLEKEAANASEQLIHELGSYGSYKGNKPAQILRICYERLDPQWKPCLLYLGQFPQGQDIEVEKLYLLLAAEDLIPRAEESNILLKSIRDFLGELGRKNFVQVQEDIVSNCKYCRLHELVREFCTSQGSDEEFFKIVDFVNSTELGLDTRRLAIYMSKYSNGKSIPFKNQDTVKKIRSLLIFDVFKSAGEKSEWPSEINDLKEFIHLRVINFVGVNFEVQKVPRGMDRLVLLRCLSFRGCRLVELPSSVSKLMHLESLDLLVRSDCEMVIPSNTLTNMTKLLHLYLPSLYRTEGKSKLQLKDLERLEILVNFNTEVCDVADLLKFKKLKILKTISKGGQEDLKAILDVSEGSCLQQLSVDLRDFDRYISDNVSKLKELLKCKHLQSIHIKGAVGEFEEEGISPLKLAEMVLDSSEIEQKQLDYLGKIQTLRSLVLSNDAFLGTNILISAASNFPTLSTLKLHNLRYLKTFTVEEGAMPELSTLEIDSCPRLHDRSIPKKVLDRLKKGQ